MNDTSVDAKMYLNGVEYTVDAMIGCAIYNYIISFIRTNYSVEFFGQPSASRYKERLEDLTKVKLSSCRVVKKKMAGEGIYGAIFKLSQSDFTKALDAVRVDTSFLCKDVKFRTLTLSMLQDMNIDTVLIEHKYVVSYDNYTHLYFLEKKCNCYGWKYNKVTGVRYKKRIFVRSNIQGTDLSLISLQNSFPDS